MSRAPTAACALPGSDCQRLKVPSKGACRPCIDPLTDVPITDLGGPEWLGWLEVVALFGTVDYPAHLPGVRRYYVGEPASMVSGRYFKPDVVACVRETLAVQVEARLGAQDNKHG